MTVYPMFVFFFFSFPFFLVDLMSGSLQRTGIVPFFLCFALRRDALLDSVGAAFCCFVSVFFFSLRDRACSKHDQGRSRQVRNRICIVHHNDIRYSQGCLSLRCRGLAKEDSLVAFVLGTRTWISRLLSSLYLELFVLYLMGTRG